MPARSAAPWAALVCTLVIGAIEIERDRLLPLPAGRYSTIYAVGDSVTAGLGRHGETTWPAILRGEHVVRVVDLSRAGSTVRQALRRVQRSPMGGGVVVLEIGGNDLLGRTPTAEFERDLESLVQTVEGQDRELVMFELPRFPFDDAYGIAQRRVADRHGVRLIPRRYFAGILATPGATVDGIHLSNAGQRELAAMIWRVVRPAMGAR